MKDHEILLPITDNDGRSMFHSLYAFENYALCMAGGFTKCSPVEGVWRNAALESVTDNLIPYRVMCSPIQWNLLVKRAFELWPDQEAIFHVEFGDATIATRAPIRPNTMARTWEPCPIVGRNSQAKLDEISKAYDEFDRGGFGR
jgi:hypothetical protein